MESRSFTWNGRDEWIKGAAGVARWHDNCANHQCVNHGQSTLPSSSRRPFGPRSRVTSALVTGCRHVAESSISIPPPSLARSNPWPRVCVCVRARRGLATRDFRWIPANNMTWLVRRSLNRWFAYGFVTLLDWLERCVFFSSSFLLSLFFFFFFLSREESMNNFFDRSSFGIINFYIFPDISDSRKFCI